ncbi:Mth938-like domain-containing protein [Parvibaculum sp. MBR-TMA-1.3b-4.2]|jgi:uncharacterized protein
MAGPSSSKPQFSGQPLIEAYGDFGFRLEGQRFEGSVLLTPSGLYPWPMTELSGVTAESLAPAVSVKPSFDILLFGAGASFARLPREIAEMLEEEGISFDVMDSPAAARTYNLLMDEGRRVAAAILAVE